LQAERLDLGEFQLSHPYPLSQPSDGNRSRDALTGVRLGMRQLAIASDRELVGLARAVARDKDVGVIVSGDFEHVTHLAGDSLPGTMISNLKV
jgi:hypothetical protein